MSNEKFIESCLRAHNDYRKHHGAAPLKHTKAISAVSQKWAEHLANTNTFEHSNNRKYKGGSLGENIAMKWTSAGGDYTGEEATSQWYNEINKYDFKRHAGGGTGHFTQVVWKGSQELGVGRAQGKDGKWIVVANYFPAGNVIGHHPENVFPPSGGKPAAAQSRPSSGDKKKPTATPGVSGNAPTRIIVPAQPTGSRMANNSPQMHVTRVTTHTPPQSVSRVTTHTPELFPSFHVDAPSPFHSKTKVKTTVRTADMTSSGMTSSGGVASYKKTTVVTETRVDGDGKKTLVKREVVSGDGDWPTGRSGSGLTGRTVVRTKVVRH